jgi:cytochrome c oxidase subunit 2
MIEQFLVRASSYAADVDNLVILITVLVGVWFLIAEAVLFWLIFRWRARDGMPAQYLTGKEKHIKKWINGPHYIIIAFDIVIIVAAVLVWVKIKQTLPPADGIVRVVGRQWVWAFQHPGADGRLDTADDIRTTDDLHVQADKTYHFELQSEDVLHSFFIPAFRIKHDAIPGRTIVGWFKPTRTGKHDVLCAEICGIGHGVMGGTIHIETPEQHAAWVAEHTTVAEADTTTAAAADSTATTTN